MKDYKGDTKSFDNEGHISTIIGQLVNMNLEPNMSRTTSKVNLLNELLPRLMQMKLEKVIKAKIIAGTKRASTMQWITMSSSVIV